MQCVKVKAFAKLNLVLNVCEKMPNGFHNLDGIMQNISLFDEISVSADIGNKITVNCDIPDLCGTGNIVYKAIKLFLESAKIENDINVFIKKHIPVSAGLGGGSTDAAAVLAALNKMYGYPLSRTVLNNIALNLGADVPFFLLGGTAVATGVGEKLKKIQDMPDCCFVLVKYGNKSSTAEMYKMLDNTAVIHPQIKAAIMAIENGNLKILAKEFSNSFADLWDFSDVYNVISQYNPLGCTLTGSGPTVFAAFDSENTAKNCRNALKNNGFECYLCNPVKISYEFE